MRECVLVQDALLLLRQESMSRLCVTEVDLNGVVVQDMLSAQANRDAGTVPWSFALSSRLPGGGAPTVLVASNQAEKEAWLQALTEAVSELLPVDVRLQPGWLHRHAAVGSLWSAAVRDDATLAAALCSFTTSARARGTSGIAFDEKQFPELDIDAADGDGISALHYAARLGHCGVLQVLLENGARMEVQDSDFNTPLHAALEEASEGSLKAAAVLVGNEAALETRNLLDQTPLQTALHVLLARAATPSAALVRSPSADGASSPSSAAAASTAGPGDRSVELLSVIRMMLGRGACVRGCDSDGLEVLHRAVTQPAVAAALLAPLVQAGADANAPVALVSDPSAAAVSVSPTSAAPAAAAAAVTGGPLAAHGRPAGEVCAPLHLAAGIGAVWAHTVHALREGTSTGTEAASAAGAARAALADGWPLVREGVFAALLEAGAQPNARTLPNGETAMHLLLRLLAILRNTAAGPGTGVDAALIAGQVAEVSASLRRLAANGARVDVADAGGATPAQLADSLGVRGALDAASAAAAAFAAKAPHAAAASVAPRLAAAQRRCPAPDASPSGPRNRLESLCPSHPARLGQAMDAGGWEAGDAAAAARGEGGGCAVCGAGFTLLKRKHHCRHCGVLACGACSAKKLPLLHPGGPDSDDDADGGSGSGRAAKSKAVAASSFGLRGPAAAASPTAAAASAGAGSGPVSEERVCDGCFNRLSAAVEGSLRAAADWEREKSTALAAARNFSTGSAPGGGGAAATRATSTGSAGGAGAGGAASSSDAAASRDALFAGRSAAGSAAGAGGRDRQVQGQMGDIKATLGDAHERLGQRGEKLSRLEEKTKAMADNAAGFAAAAAKLKQQAKGGGGWFGF
jgi:hypothetical protein